MEFLPFQQIDAQHPTVVVDSRHPAAAATLSHWRGAPTPEALRADTSTEIALNAISAGHACLQLPFVSNNHFDVDGFLGIWSLMNPTAALARRDLLVLAAEIGDFREYDPAHPEADLALKLVCWLNSMEKQLFYAPFADKQESEGCLPKYDFFLERLATFLDHPHDFQADWQDEYEQVRTETAYLQRAGTRTWHPEIRLLHIEVPKPLHYYVLFQQSAAADLVLMQFSDGRYELEYKYHGWVDTVTRCMYPRLSFDPLLRKLTEWELSPLAWQAPGIMDTGPAVQLGGNTYTKADRFAHPYERVIPASSIPPEQFSSMVIEHYREALTNVQPRYRWTWEAMRQFST